MPTRITHARRALDRVLAEDTLLVAERRELLRARDVLARLAAWETRQAAGAGGSTPATASTVPTR